MKVLYIFGVFCLFVAAWAAPVKLDQVKPIAWWAKEILDGGGNYKFSFESEDDTKVEESGSQKQVGPTPEDIGPISRGSYSFTSPDGVVLTVFWVADENGFIATGDHLPTPPPMPEH